MFFCLDESLCRIVGSLLALRLNGREKIAGAGQSLSRLILLHPRNRPVSRTVLNLGGSGMTVNNCGPISTPWRRTHVSECQESKRVVSSEAETVRRAQQGDAVAFERIYLLHGPRIYALCLRIVRNPAEAEDLTQEAFLRVFRKIHMFRGESAFSTWLYRLALNVVLMKLRKKHLPEASLEETTKSNEESTGHTRRLVT
jgi:hypothetical protein